MPDINLSLPTPVLFAFLAALVLAKLLSYDGLLPELKRIWDFLFGAKKEGEIRITRLYVHPIKSTKGISVQESPYNLNGLEFDRKWAVLNPSAGVIVTAREHSKMVLVESVIDRQNNLLRVSFPSSSGLPGYAVPLNPTEEQKASYEELSKPPILHNKPLFDVLIPSPVSTSTTPTSPTPSEQWSTYLSSSAEGVPAEQPLQVQFVMQGKNKRVLLEPKPKEEDVEYEGWGETVFADGYPMLLVSEESYQHVQTSLTTFLSESTNLPPSIAKSVPYWPEAGASLELERFRPNIVVEGKGVEGPFGEERWSKIDIWADGEDKGKEEGKGVQAEKVDRGGMIVVSRCGRCQLPNVNPSTARADPSLPYKHIANYRRVDPAIKHTPCFGVNTVPVKKEGIYRVGDRVRVTAKNDWVVLDGKGKEKK